MKSPLILSVYILLIEERKICWCKQKSYCFVFYFCWLNTWQVYFATWWRRRHAFLREMESSFFFCALRFLIKFVCEIKRSRVTCRRCRDEILIGAETYFQWASAVTLAVIYSSDKAATRATELWWAPLYKDPKCASKIIPSVTCESSLIVIWQCSYFLFLEIWIADMGDTWPSLEFNFLGTFFKCILLSFHFLSCVNFSL